MTRSARELSDRDEISEVVLAYARALDRRDSALMRSILTAPGAIDSAAEAGRRPSRPAPRLRPMPYPPPINKMM